MKEKGQRGITNARTINKMRCIAGLTICALVIVLTAVTLVMNIADVYNEETPEAGLGTLRMFTTISNVIAAVAAFACLPFQIDGLRRNKYKLPEWIVTLMYVGAEGVFLTFITAATLISATQGFVPTMLLKSNLFMHTINPIFIVLLFTRFIADAHISFRRSFFTLIPVTLYAFLYFIMVFVVKEWRDHYMTNAFIPWPVSLILVLVVAFGLSQLLRFLHNLTNAHVNRIIARYYIESPDYDYPRVSDAIAHLAQVEAAYYYVGDDIYIPTDIIELLSRRYSASVVPLDIQYDIYLENYLAVLKRDGKQK